RNELEKLASFLRIPISTSIRRSGILRVRLPFLDFCYMMCGFKRVAGYFRERGTGMSIFGSRLQLTTFVALLVLGCPMGLFAQSDVGTITGFVYDPAGAVVPNAAITISNEATGAERRVTTNADGLYSVTNIPPGF